jgi:hypothetical protein
MPSITYLLSVQSVTSQGWFSAASARITAVISMRLLVVFPPPRQFLSLGPMRNKAAQPPGPGFLAGAVGEDFDLFHANTPGLAA